MARPGHMTENEQIVADLVWSQCEKPSGVLFTVAHNVYDDHYRVNAFVRTWMGMDGDLPGQTVGFSCKAVYDRESHDLKILNKTGQVDYKGLIKDAVAKSGEHVFTAREEEAKDGANFSLKK